MRDLSHIENNRHAGPANDQNGHFFFKKGSAVLSVRCSNGGGWDHVSIALKTRCPTWDEMCWIKEKFFKPDEWAMQLHPPKSENISHHNFCLHLWRPQTTAELIEIICDWEADGEKWPSEYPDESPGSIPLPPAKFVGPMA